MQTERRRRVAVVYTHPLFGMGIARLLQPDNGLQVRCLNALLPDAGEQLRRLRPHAVVLEGDEEHISFRDLAGAMPRALVIIVRLDDEVMDIYYGRQVMAACPEALVETIHRRRPPKAAT
jgi:hypothetical protein